MTLEGRARRKAVPRFGVDLVDAVRRVNGKVRWVGTFHNSILLLYFLNFVTRLQLSD